MINKSKAFLVLSPAFPENEKDTNWVPAQQIFVRVFKEKHPDIQVIVLSFLFPSISKTYSFFNCEIRSFGNTQKTLMHRLSIWIRVWKNLRELAKDYEIIGILSFWYGECALIGHWFSKFHNLKHRVWLMGQDAKKNNILAKWIGCSALEIIAISDFVQLEFYKNHKIKPQFIIPLGIEPKLFPPFQENKTWDIIGVGSFIPLKRFDYFIELIHEIIPYFPQLRACICGEGPQREMLERMIQKYGLEDHIELLGLLPYPKVLDHMSRSKILLHTSEYEGFALVFLEALYSGARVISRVKPMQRDIINWTIVSNSSEIISSIKTILSNENLISSPIIPFTMENSVRKIVEAFHYTKEAIS